MASFTNTGSDVIGRTLLEETSYENTENLEEVFEISRCVHWIQEGGYKKVGLQFPDELITDGPPVARAISEKLGFTVFILGDTTYGSCCVDEVAAEHFGADSIIHFGRTCLSPSRRIPVLYIFTRILCNASLVVEGLEAAIDDDAMKLIFLYDTRCHYIADEILSKLKEKFQQLLPSSLIHDNSCTPTSKASISPEIPHDSALMNSDEEKNANALESVVFNGRCFCIPKGSSIKDYQFIYLGPLGPTVTCLSMKFSNNTFYCVSPLTGEITTTSGIRSVMGRSSKLELVKDADIIGILVGTLGVADYRAIISRLKAIVKAAGKRSYTFVVGKPNEPKLANISEVDIFVYVACPETSIVERSVDPVLFRKLVTPWELEVALLNDQEWSTQFEVDFRQLLPGGERHVEAMEQREEEMSVSLITNKAQRLGVREETDTPLDSITGAVTVKDDLTIAALHVGGGGQALQGKTWQGLDPSVSPPAPLGIVTEGRKGIASVYQDETNVES